MFGFIGAGATLGQLFGSLFATGMAWMGPCMLFLTVCENFLSYCLFNFRLFNFFFKFIISDLLLFASILMELAAQSSKRINMDTSYLSEELSPIRYIFFVHLKPFKLILPIFCSLFFRKADTVEQSASFDEQTASAARGFSVNFFASLTKPKKWAIFDGIRLILSSTYLLQVSLFLWFSAAVSSFFYFQVKYPH